MSCTIAIIPARGGSKGVPLKNMTPVAGRPLIAYTIERALEAELVSAVYVTTDDEDISAYSRALGAKVIDRPPQISGDRAQIEDAMLHVLDNVPADSDWSGWDGEDLVVLLQPTSPLRRKHDIDFAIQHLLDMQFDSLFSATPIFPYVWLPSDHDPVNRRAYYSHGLPRLNRQDRQPLLQENGSIYVTKEYILREYRNRLGGRVGHYHMPPFMALEVDTPYDIELAEMTMRYYSEVFT